MKNIKALLKKALASLKRDGIKGFLVKVKNYIIYQFKKRMSKQSAKDILFVNGCTLPHPERYRVDHQIEQLEANGFTVDKVFYQDFDPNIIKYYRGVVIFRCPITDDVEELIKKARYFNKKVFFDVDDLVIDKKYTDSIKFVQEMSKDDRKLYDDGVVRMKEALKKCDYLITTTNALSRELKQYGKEVFVNKNVASEEMVKLSLEAKKNVVKSADEIVIGYLSGSITHNPDFNLIKPAIIKIMKNYPNVKLLVMGHLDLPGELKEFKNRVIKKPFGDWKELPEIIACLDINLAPIEESIFNEAKSENKWTEAALCKTVTVASDFGAFRDVIKDNETGMLCKTGDDWYEKIKELIEDEQKREKIANNAFEKAMKEYVTTYSGFELTKFIESKLAPNIAFVLPSTNISGGVNVVLKHCEILRKNGWDVSIINMDTKNDNIVNVDGEINVVSGIKHHVMMRFDRMVATLYTTLAYVKTYADVEKRLYLVQNFETNFNNYGSHIKRVANSTYNSMENIKYITISKWCAKWIRNDFKKPVKYAPNGIDTNKFRYKQRKFGQRVKILIEGNSKDYYKNVDESFRIANMLDPEKYEIVYLSYQGKPKDWYRVDKFYHRVSYDEVGRIYGECDILLKTSILESFSYPPLEMMATGGYVIVVPNEGNQEYLENEKNCLFYTQGNIEEAVEKIKKLVEDKSLRDKLAKNAKKTVAERSWNDIEDKIMDLYK